MGEGSGRGVRSIQCTGSACQSAVARVAMIVRARIHRPSTAAPLAAARTPTRTVVTVGGVVATCAVVTASVAVAAGCGVTGVRHIANREKESSENRKNAHYTSGPIG